LNAELVISGGDAANPSEILEDRRGHKGAERRCVASGETRDKSSLIRFVKGPEDVIVPDIMEKLPGRGVWVSAEKTMLETAMKSGAFSRGFKSKTSVNSDLTALTTSLLRRRVLSLMTMSLKAGQAYMGFDQVKSAAQGTPLAWRIEASDGSSGGRSKIRVLTKSVAKELEQPEAGVIGCFTSAELGKAFGREDIVHAAIKAGPMAKAFNQAARRLSGFCDLVPQNWEDKEHEVTKFSMRFISDKG